MNSWFKEETKCVDGDEFLFKTIEDPDEKSRICGDILSSIPEWFESEEANQIYRRRIRNQIALVVKKEGRAVGFLGLEDHNPYTSEIYVFGIRKGYQRHGLGRELVSMVTEELRKHPEKKYLTVKTLGESRPDPFYEKTRAFYRKMGFLPLEEMKTLWSENNPCLFMIKDLR